MHERSYWSLVFASLACGGAAAPVVSAPSRADDAATVLAQELGEQPAPDGPCPEHRAAQVLQDPRAAAHRTGNGLAYCILQEGPAGVVPGPNDTVKVQYTGWTDEGEVFDSSVERGAPLEAPLNQLIPGWGEGLRLMTPGDKARLWIPGSLAYGPREPGAPAGSPPKGTLVFDVELLDVQRAPSEPTTPAVEALPPSKANDAPRQLGPRIKSFSPGGQGPGAPG